jgi:protein-S-isoprenylcysteine O-methyltransferase Ste14
MLLKLIILGTVAWNLLAFAAAVRTHFVWPDGMTAGMRLIMWLGYSMALLHLLSHALIQDLVLWRVVTGLLLCWISLWLFHSARQANRDRPLSIAGSLDQPGHLNQRGPYAYIRHPFYASYLYTWAGGALMGPWWLWCAPLLFGVIYWRAARAEEDKFLSSPLAADYCDYMQRTGRFLPRLNLP